jgi:hypothetical protein
MWTTPENFRVKIGGNYYINVPNLIVESGVNLFTLKRRDDGLLAIDFDIYDASGNKVATVRNGNIVQHDSDRFQAHKEHHRYWIEEKSSGRVICDIRKAAKAEDGSELEVSVDLFTKSGFHFIAGSEETNLAGTIFRDCTISNSPTGISIE